MGSGEGDAIRNIYISSLNNNSSSNTIWPTTAPSTWPTTYYYTYSSPVYYYQIKCPKRGCKTMNWLELDKVTPCRNCGSKLRAVDESQMADFETTITR